MATKHRGSNDSGDRAARRMPERAASEESLRQARELLETVAETTGVIVAVVDTTLRYTFFNRAYRDEVERLSGKVIEIGSSLVDTFAHLPEQQKIAVEAWRRVLEGQSTTKRIDFGDPGSYRRTYSVRHTPLLDAEGNVIAAGEVAFDVTDRVRAEEALQASEERYRRIVETAREAILVTDEQGAITYVNEPACQMFGYEARELVGRRGLDLLFLDDDRAEGEARWQARRGGKSDLVREVRYRRKDGSPVWVMLSASPMYDGEDKFVGSLAMMSDITERKQAQDALRAANEKLVDADRRKNEFLAVLSHELRNPLAPIRNSLHILDHVPPGSEQALRARTVVSRQVDQLARLIDDLLDVTRISRNKIQLQRQRLDLAELVRRTTEDHRSLFDQNGVELELGPLHGPVHIDGDPNRLAQVIGNLLQNAAKFAGRGRAARVCLETDTARRRAVVRVTDTGVGMAGETLERLFEPFVQVATTIDRSQGGLGLGLSLVKGLVALHGGEVRVHSAGLDQGTEIVISLPFDPDPVPLPAADPSPPCRRRVLIIEDNVDSADTLCDVLQFDEHEVAVSYTGADGIARAREFRPDVVLCDIGLPGMDGYEVAKVLRADQQLERTVLVALSGYALPEDIERARKAGFDQHVAKPLSLIKLRSLLAEGRL